MDNKNSLLSIGEIAKLSGVGIKSLRYYEKINILKPAYVDSDSGYRYYSLNQIHLIILIKFAIEMDIPLREFVDFLDQEGIMDFRAFSVHAKKVAEKKIKALEKGLEYIDFFEQQLALEEKYPLGLIYTRKLPEKFFYVVPCKPNFANIDQYEISKLISDVAGDEDTESGWPEYGILLKHSPQGIKHYLFAEVTPGKANYQPIPAGTYYCQQNDTYNFWQAQDIFADYLAGKDSFIVIETEIFSARININKPISELRVIAF